MGDGATRPWRPGDRASVQLPDRKGLAGRVGSMHWFPGTVAEVDPPGSPPGVRVKLDYAVNGLGDCYATHGELRALPDREVTG